MYIGFQRGFQPSFTSRVPLDEGSKEIEDSILFRLSTLLRSLGDCTLAAGAPIIVRSQSGQMPGTRFRNAADIDTAPRPNLIASFEYCSLKVSHTSNDETGKLCDDQKQT